jgi:signal transduction histidine kinase
MKSKFGVLVLTVVGCTTLWAQSEIEELEAALASARGTERVDILNRLAKVTQGNSPRESIRHAQQGLELAEKIDDDEGKARALNNLGAANYFLGEYDLALDYYERSLDIAEKIKDDERIANALNNIGVIYFVWGQHDQSLEYYTSALEIREKIGDKRGIAVAYNNLGNVYDTAGRYEESLKYYSEALPLYQELGEEAYAASTRNNIGLSMVKMERYDEALVEFQLALEDEERIDDKSGLARSLDHIGMVYDAWGRHREALDHHRRALTVRREIGDRQGEAISLLNIGLNYIELEDYEQSRANLDRALDVAKDLNLTEVQRDIYKAMSVNHESTGNFESALTYHRLFKETHDQLFDEQTGRRLAELQARHEVETKDREIELLRKRQEIQRVFRDAALVGTWLLLLIARLLYNAYRLKARANREILKANEALKLAQEERDKAARAELAHVSRVATLGELAAALAHELRQPLTAILSNAQATRRLLVSDTIDRNEIDEALGDIVEGAGRSRDIIQKLRDMMRRGDIAREPLDLNDALRSVQPFAQADAKQHGATLSLDLDDKLPPISGDRIQLQQVMLNLVHNAAEAMAGASDAKEIVVQTSRPDSRTVLVAVRDAGPKLDSGVIERMFDPFFTTKPEGLGMGLSISHTIIEAHGGRLWATRNPDRGLTVQFTLPSSTDG